MTECRTSICVIIPTLNAGRELPALLECLHDQTVRPDEIIVIDSDSDDSTSLICRNDPAITFISIKRSDYDHGGTRDLAFRRSSCDIVVVLSQDARPADRDFLRKLTAPITEGKAAISTGRQIPRMDATRMEALVREFNYPNKSYVRSAKDLPRLGIKTFFCSNACCAYDREVYLKLGGFEHHLKTNEDMFFAAKAINNGYRIAYAADAAVIHSHKFSITEQYKRNHIQGYEIARHRELLGTVSLENEGAKLALYVSGELLRHGHLLSFCHFGLDCAARLSGSLMGRAAYLKKSDKLYSTEKTGGEPAQVCVLMSTYNGEKYLQKQLDSLHTQKGVRVRIIVRDDGSEDATLSILEDNQNAHDSLRWYNDAHCGAAASFLKIIKDAPDSDYYALCDQDDVWDADKLKCATDMLRSIPADQPALYYSNLRIVDDELNYHRNAHSRPWVMKSRYSALADVAATGCTMVFNRALRELLRERMPAACKMHDEWIYLVSRFFGTVLYDFEPHISYRQHGGNALGMDTSGFSFGWLKQKISRTNDKSWLPRSVNARSFCDAYGDMLAEEELKKVRKAAGYKESVLSRLALLADLSIHGKSVKDDLIYRIKIISGKA